MFPAFVQHVPTGFANFDESTETLVHAFVTSRVDYCNTVLAGTLMSFTDRLQRVLNAAARHHQRNAQARM